MFQFRRFPSHTYLIQYGIPCGGFPHSEISGSQLICSSPKLIAAYHVLHRLLMPRHSPCALCNLTFRRNRWSKFIIFNFSQLIDSPIGSLYSWIMQAHVSRSFLAKNCIFTHLSFEIETEKKFPLLLPSHNCIIITMFSFQGTWLSFQIRSSMKSQLFLKFQSTSNNCQLSIVNCQLKKWWR